MSSPRYSTRVRRWSIVSLLVSVALLVAHPQAALAQDATITGNVFGGPVSGLSVTATETDVDVPYTAEVLGSSYTIKLPPGNYQVIVNPVPLWISNPVSYRLVVQPNSYNSGYNFTLSPATNTISGQVSFLNPALCTHDYSAVQMPVYLYTFNNGQETPFQSTSTTVPDRASNGLYSFDNVPPGNYLVVVGDTGKSKGGYNFVSLQYANVTNQTIGVWRTLYNICGSVTQLNGQPAPGTVSAFVYNALGQYSQFLSATVQWDGTYIFQNVPPNVWGVFIDPNPGWIYAPAPPFFQTVFLSDDAIGINFSAQQSLYNITGDFFGLPYGEPVTLWLWNLNGGGWVTSTNARYLQQWVFTGIPPGRYAIYASMPPSFTIISPTTLTATVVNSNVYAGAFQIVVSDYGTVSGAGYTTPQPGGPSGFADPYMAINSSDYVSDTYQLRTLGGNFINWYTSKSPYPFSLRLHPGNYSWTMRGTAGLIAVPASGNFPIAAKKTTSIGRIAFFKSGPGVSFIPNPCSSAVCSGGASMNGNGDVPHASVAQLGGRLNNSVQQQSTTCVTPMADLAQASKTSALPRTQVSSAASALTTEDSGSAPPACTSTVDLTQVSSVDFNGGFGAPDPDNPGSNLPDPTVPAANTTVQFTGVLYAPADGTYQFQSTSNGPVSLTVNSVPVIQSWIDSQQTQTGSVTLAGGHQYSVTMSYAYDSVSTAAVNLAWQKPGDAAFATIDSIYYAPNSTLKPLQDWVLTSNGQIDNYTTNDPLAQQDAAAAGYSLSRTEGCAYQYQLPNTIPLNVYSNGTDYFTTSTDLTQQPGGLGSYNYVGIAGYIYPSALTDGTSVPLETWFGNNDNYATASQSGIHAAQQAGYVFLQNEGWVLPVSACQ